MGKERNVLRTLFFIVLADMLGFGLIIPLLPYYAKEFGASALMIGLLGSVYPLGQIFASPLIGRLSDKYGRKRALLLSVGGTFVSLLILGFAKSLSLIFFSRLFDGLTGGNITVAQSYIGDFTDEKSRTKSLGLIGAAFGLGFIFGPAFGGFLSQWGMRVPAFFATGLSLINIINILLFLPDSKPVRDSKSKPFTFQELKKTFSQPAVASLLFTKFFYSLGFTMFESTFALFAISRLNLPVSTTSFILAYVGVIIVFVQGFLIGKLTKKYSEADLIRYGIFLAVPFLVLYSFAKSIPVLLVLLAPLSVFSAVLGVSISSMATKLVSKDKLGGALGIFNSVDSLMRIISPVLGATIVQYIGAKYLGVVEGFAMFLSAIVFGSLFLPKYSAKTKNEKGQLLIEK
ncbi:MFS transporter [Fervidobacterium gondwanense]|uniref:MFS transporter, DHA1 family, tetracycline resistance protein n=1 Tax=Fervidobacterium gondwanense DSM 13020 TaxID=1121883 RepID=A0A1M7SJL2_FERGO|nr:MFS transporter [Fervidobacterium gondwanense]SHN58656.1 MFS transporter, DHA1 family, tetracycline resistance protein [Fervidobacterium gondwanense DSM 13020]